MKNVNENKVEESTNVEQIAKAKEKALATEASVENVSAPQGASVEEPQSELSSDSSEQLEESSAQQPTKKRRFGFVLGFLLGLVVAIVFAIFPTIEGLNVNQRSENALAVSEVEKTDLKIEMAMSELAQVETSLREIEAANEAHMALMATKPKLLREQTALEKQIQNLFAEKAEAEKLVEDTQGDVTVQSFIKKLKK